MSRARRHAATSLVVGVVLAVWGCGAPPGKPQRAEAPSPEQRADALYALHCAGCHGAGGRLGAARPLADGFYLSWIGKERLQRVTAEGVAGSLMPGFATRAGGPLDDEDLDLLASGLMRRWAASAGAARNAPAYAASTPGDPQRGAALFQRHCADCHGADGTGAVRGGDVVDPAYLALVSDQALRSAVVAGREDLGMPGFAGQAPQAAMSDREIADVVAWLASQRGREATKP